MRAVGACAAEDDADAFLRAALGQRVQQRVEGVRLPRLEGPRAEADRRALHGHHRVGRDHPDPVRAERVAIRRLLDRELRVLREEFRKDAAMLGVEMLHHQERRPGGDGRGVEEPLQRIQTASRRADRHDRMPRAAVGRIRARSEARRLVGRAGRFFTHPQSPVGPTGPASHRPARRQWSRALTASADRSPR